MLNEAFEYTVTKKREGKYLFARIAMICLYVLYAVGFFLVCYITRFIPVFALCPFTLWIIVFFTWRYVNIEYKYTVDSGMLKLYIIYGGKSIKEKAAFHIKDAIGFIPFSKDSCEIKAFNSRTVYSLLSSSHRPQEPYALMINKDGADILVLLETDEKARKSISYYLKGSIRH